MISDSFIKTYSVFFGFNQVVKYNLFPGWHQPFTAQYMLINKEEWDKATDAQKALVESVCTAAVTRGLAEGEYKNGAVLAGFQAEGVHANQIPDDILKQLKAVTEEVLAEEAANDEDFKRVYESQQEFQKTYAVWDSRAYLSPELTAPDAPEEASGEAAATGEAAADAPAEGAAK